ncbi:replication initiation protein [Psychrobacter sp. N25K4-3-2]|uniref:replication initiation protein n=1 Tax=unclassified Psychrobacter TaxID=196806 RepID=UPI00188B97C4|nr:replication initiation protein [Psychrobacter sp. N25K4-3-2]MBF4490854.1 replication initiation protein [Psychrobacter sp. N25K4-3-2]
MTPSEFKELQEKLRDDVGQSYTVKVDKHLSADERDELIKHIKKSIGDADATILIVEPNIEPQFDFKYELQANTNNDENGHLALPKLNENVPAPHNGWVYADNLIVMQNRLLNAITNLDFNERRLIMYLSHIVRKAVDLNPEQRTFVVTALEFHNEYDVGKNNVYDLLANVADSLLHKAFFFWNFEKDEIGNRKGSSWVAECEYLRGNGCIEVTLTDTVTEMLTIFDRSNPYTQYERQYIVNLGSYGIIMFELINSCLYLRGKKKAYSIEYLRKKFNCEDTYDKVTDFRIKVIDKAIKEVEKHTPLRITYTKQKNSREIVGLVFSFKNTAAKKVDKNDKPTCLTEKQAKKYSFQLKDKHEIVGDWSIKSYDEAQKRIEKELQEPEKYDQYLSFLKKYTDYGIN